MISPEIFLPGKQNLPRSTTPPPRIPGPRVGFPNGKTNPRVGFPPRKSYSGVSFPGGESYPVFVVVEQASPLRHMEKLSRSAVDIHRNKRRNQQPRKVNRTCMIYLFRISSHVFAAYLWQNLKPYAQQYT